MHHVKLIKKIQYYDDEMSFTAFFDSESASPVYSWCVPLIQGTPVWYEDRTPSSGHWPLQDDQA